MLWKFLLLSVDIGIRCDWLLALHAALKAKSREKRTHNLHYNWEQKTEVTAQLPASLLPLHVFERATFYWFLD